MTLYAFKNARFITTATKPAHYPVLRNAQGDILPEIAVVGRSNVGKSSLLNHLFHAKGLVKTSSSPGKTQAVNFFTLNDQIGFVDLPGYGYAKVSIEVRKDWAPMIENYLGKRENLKLVLFLFDIRRIPNEEDIGLLNWIMEHNKHLLLILTKVDKVTLNVRNTNTAKILEALSPLTPTYIHYSAPKNIGRQHLIKMIVESLNKTNELPHD